MPSKLKAIVVRLEPDLQEKLELLAEVNGIAPSKYLKELLKARVACPPPYEELVLSTLGRA